jgi:uncharacterized protein involved in outer membrane biogenesis
MKAGFFGKKIVIVFMVVVVLLVAAFALLLYFSNRILKAEIEKTLGERGKIERISLSWNKVDVYGVDLSKDGQSFFRATKVEVRASFLTLFGNRYAISYLIVEQPALVLQIDAQGNVVNPLEGGQDKAKEKGTPSMTHPVDLRHVIVSGGAVTVNDEQLKGAGPVELTGVEARVDNVSFPIGDSSIKVSLRMNVKGKTASGTVTCSGSINPKTLAWELTVGAANIEALTDSRGAAVKAGALRFVASSKGQGQGTRNILLSGVTVAEPFIRVEEDKSGNLVSPPLPGKPAKGQKPEKSAVSLTLNDLTVTGGEVLYLDGKISRPPHPIRITDISLKTDSFSIPATDKWTAWQLSAHIPGKASTGQLGGAGRTNLHGFDTSGKLTLRNLDMLVFKPYVQKKGEADLRGGTFDMDMDLTVKDKYIHAPTHTVIKNLQFTPGGTMDRFLGIPRSLIVKLLETSKNEIPLDFVVEGRLDDPKFNLSEDLVRKFAVAIGRKLGLNVVGTGESVVTQGGKVLKGIGKGLRGIFK